MDDIRKQLQQIQQQITLMQEAILLYDDDLQRGYSIASSFAQIACSATERTIKLEQEKTELTNCLRELIKSSPNIALTSSSAFVRELALSLLKESKE